jgi:hypothetical protein
MVAYRSPKPLMRVRILLPAHMKDTIIKYYLGQPIQMNEAINLMNEYMEAINKPNPLLIQSMLDPMNVFGQGMIQKAVEVSANYLAATKYSIIRVYSKENQILMVY